jgi:RimJ/RimL family protein N-acetyltransferase
MTTLTTARLVLREFVEDDWAALHAIVSLPEVVRYQTEDVFDEAATRAAIAVVMAGAAAVPRLHFDFVVTLEGALIGRTGMKRGEDPRMASMWFEIAPVHHGKGYGAEAARALLGHAFEEVGLHRVSGDCDPRNPASARVM